MIIHKTVEVTFTDEELVELIANEIVPLGRDETWELVNSYTAINNYIFRIVKKDEGDDNEDHC